jgi:Mg/Co/Ni transporter MgtE
LRLKLAEAASSVANDARRRWHLFGFEISKNYNQRMVDGVLTTFPGQQHLLAATVAVSLSGVVAFATLVGSMLPFIFRRMSLDAATASALFIATFVDFTGLIIYFNVALHILLRWR